MVRRLPEAMCRAENGRLEKCARREALVFLLIIPVEVR
jgi:hypothetical protein